MGAVLCGLAAVCVILPLAAAKADSPIAIVTFLAGPVDVQKAGAVQWNPLRRGDYLYEDQVVKTGRRAQVALFYTEGTELRLNGDTTLNVGTKEKKVVSAGMQVVRTIKLMIGEFWGQFAKTSDTGVSYDIKTSSAVAAVKGTKLDSEAQSSGASAFSVMEGLVQVSNNLGSVNVGAGMKTTVQAGGAPTAPKSFASRAAWEAGMNGKSPKTLILKIKGKGGAERELKVFLQK